MKLLTLFFSFFIVFAGPSCKNENKKVIVTNKDILFFKGVLAYEDLTKLDTTILKRLNDSLTLNSLTDTVRYEKNEIYVSYLTLTNGCGSYTGDFFISHDTIKLKLISTSTIACTEEVCDRIIYRLKRRDDKKYKIIKAD